MIDPPMANDLEIAQSVSTIAFDQVAACAGILADELELFGKRKAKVRPPTRPVHSDEQIVPETGRLVCLS